MAKYNTRFYNKEAETKAEQIVQELQGLFRERQMSFDGMTLGELYGDNARSMFELLFANDNTAGFYMIAAKTTFLHEGDRVDLAVEEYHKKIEEAGLKPEFYAEKFFNNTFAFEGVTLDEYTGFRTVARVKASQIVDYLMNMKVDEFTNYYITYNMTRNGSTKAEYTFSLMSLVKDIDCHKKPKDMTKKDFRAVCKELCASLLQFLPEEVRPHVVNFSGRGLQLIFRFTKCSFKLLWLYQKLNALIDQLLEKFFNEHKEFDMFMLDNCNSSPMHYYRLPFTYNIAGETWGEAVTVREAILDINTVVRTFYKAVNGAEMPMPNRETRRENEKVAVTVLKAVDKKESRIQKAIANVGKKIKEATKTEPATEKRSRGNRRGYANLLDWRCAFIEYLVDRMHNHIGFRNTLYFNYLTAAAQCHKMETAEEMAEKLNMNFSVPLPDHETQSVCAAIKRNGLFDITAMYQELKKYKQSTWLGFFKNIANFEDYLADFRAMRSKSSSTKKENKRAEVVAAKVNEKMERDEQIRKLSTAGYLKKEIAEIVGVCRKTVYNVLNKVCAYAGEAMSKISGAPVLMATPI